MAEKNKKPLPTSTTKNQLALPPTDSRNRYQVLGQVPKTSYSSALVHTPSPSHIISPPNVDPFSSTQTIQPSPHKFPYPTRTTEYVLKSVTTNLFSIEPIHKNIHNPIELVNPFFPLGWHFIPAHPDKNLSFYKNILLHHKSIVINPITDRVNPNKVIYHSLYIHNIVSLDEWGHPSLFRTLPNHPLQYNYYDYIDAWFKVILHENESFTHSWFFSFDHKFKSVIPSWFSRWWYQNGAIPDLLPIELKDQVNYFSTLYPVNSHTSQFPILLLFMAKYKVPWIFKWRYSINGNTVIRQYLVKWWDQYKHQRIIDQVKQEFPVKVPTPVKIPAAQIQPINIPAAQIQPSSPNFSTIRLGSPAPSSSKPPKSKSKTKCSQLLMLAQQLIAQASQEEDDTSSEESTTATSHRDPYGSAFQDAQDPFA